MAFVVVSYAVLRKQMLNAAAKSDWNVSTRSVISHPLLILIIFSAFSALM